MGRGGSYEKIRTAVIVGKTGIVSVRFGTKWEFAHTGSITEKCTVCGKITKTTIIACPKEIKLSCNSYTYDGKVKTPTVKVYNSNGKVINSDNYLVYYQSGKKNTGTYLCTITFKGNYSGKQTTKFKICQAKAAVQSISVDKNSITVRATSKVTALGGERYQIAYRMSGTTKWSYVTTTALNKKISGLKKARNIRFVYVHTNGWATIFTMESRVQLKKVLPLNRHICA